MTNSFKQKHSLEERLKTSEHILDNFPDRVPILVLDPNNIGLSQHKFIIPKDFVFGQFLLLVKGKIQCKKEEAIFLFTQNGTICVPSHLISEIYKNYSDPEDKFLYLVIKKENTFGSEL